MEPAELAKMYQDVQGIRYYKTVTTDSKTVFGSCSLCGAVCSRALWEQHSLWHIAQDQVALDATIQNLKKMAEDLDHDGLL